MRNLKRALSLGLTAAMISGLMVMGSSAASYADVTSEDNQEAIEVLQTVGIMVGDENGDFNPDQNVTRNEMAVVMSNLMEYNVATYSGTSPFTDVPSWAEPYVAACWTNGITAGTSATTYGGSDSVTTAQAALMLMRALGYFQYESDFGSDWQLATITQGNRINLFDDVDSGVREAMTRNDLAQLVLNTLEAGTVEASTNGSITVGDVTINTNVEYNYVTSGSSYARAIDASLYTSNDGQYSTGSIVQLGERLYQGDLTREDGSDAFGRPASVWAYQNEEIGRYADTADYTFTDKVTPDDLYSTLGRTITGYSDWEVYVNGDSVNYDGDNLYATRTNDDDFLKAANLDEQTGRGVLTEVFVDNADESVTIAIIHTYVADVNRVYSNASDPYITLNDLSSTPGPVRSSDQYETDQFEEGDIVLYTYAENDIQTVAQAQEMSGEVTRVTSGTSFVVDGTTYRYTFGTVAEDMLETTNVNNDVVAYLDAYGYVIYIDESATSYDYAVVLDVGRTSGRYTTDPQFGATLLLTDGTVVEADLDVPTDMDQLSEVQTAYLNHIVSYTIDNDEYTLTVRSGSKANQDENGQTGLTNTTLVIENDRSRMTIGSNSNIYANSNTVFLLDDGDDNYTVYTGIANVPDIEGDGNSAATYYCASGNVARLVYVRGADVSGQGTVVFVEADRDADEIHDRDDGNYYQLNAVVDGEVTTIRVKTGTDAAAALVTGATTGDPYMVAYKSLVYNGDGLVTDVRDFSSGDVDTYVGTRSYQRNDATVGLGYNDTEYYTYADDYVVVYYDGDELRTSRISSVGNDDNDNVIAAFDDGQIVGLCITEVEDGEEDDTVVPDGVVTSKFNNDESELYIAVYGSSSLSNDEIGAYLESQGYTDVRRTSAGWSFNRGYDVYTGVDVTVERVYQVRFTSEYGVTSGATAYLNDDNFNTATVVLGNDNNRNWTGLGASNIAVSGASMTVSSATPNSTGSSITVNLTVSSLSANANVTLGYQA